MEGQGGKKRGPFGLMCEAPHTYLTEQDNTVGHLKQRTAEGLDQK